MKPDFAPDAESESDSYDDEEPNSAGSPTSFTKSLDKGEKNKKKKKSPKKAKEKGEWDSLFWAEKSEKKKYLKQSERMVKIDAEPNPFRSKSVVKGPTSRLTNS